MCKRLNVRHAVLFTATRLYTVALCRSLSSLLHLLSASHLAPHHHALIYSSLHFLTSPSVSGSTSISVPVPGSGGRGEAELKRDSLSALGSGARERHAPAAPSNSPRSQQEALFLLKSLRPPCAALIRSSCRPHAA